MRAAVVVSVRTDRRGSVFLINNRFNRTYDLSFEKRFSSSARVRASVLERVAPGFILSCIVRFMLLPSDISPRGLVAFATLLVLFSTIPASANYRIKDEAPPEVRKYLENAVKTGKPAHEKRVAQAKAEVDQAKADLETVRRAFRKLKAKRTDLQAAEEKVALAEKNLASVRAEPPLALASLDTLDRDGAIGVLPHGIGISRVVDEKRAIVFVFVERAGADDGKLFSNTDEIGKEVVPSKSPLVLVGVETQSWSEGDRLPGDRTVYRVGKIETVDDQQLHVLTRVDMMQYLETAK